MVRSRVPKDKILWIHGDRLAALSLGKNCIGQTFFDDQPEPEPMADLCKQIRDKDRFARIGHPEQDAMLWSVTQPDPDSDKIASCPVEGRLKFGDGKNSATSPCTIIVFTVLK